MSKCPCKSGLDSKKCCDPLLSGEQTAATAEALMRSRYVAYARNDMDYVERTTHPSMRAQFDRASSQEWASKSEWLGLEVVGSEKGQAGDATGTVEFIASYKLGDQDIHHRELSEFRKEKGVWFFYDGKTLRQPFIKAEPKVGRNDPCACGSGAKYKKCCGANVGA